MFRSLGANIWDHEMPIRFGGIPLWHRMTVIRLTNGGLVVHSPTRLDLASRQEFQKLGPIVAFIAPSWWHDLHLREYLCAYPDARLYGAPTLVNGINRCLSQKFSGTRHLHCGRTRSIKFMFRESAFFWTRSCSIIGIADRSLSQTYYSI